MATPSLKAGVVPLKEPNGPTASMESASARVVSSNTVPPAEDAAGAIGRQDESVGRTRAKSATAAYPEPPAYFDEALEDAEGLLKYAAEAGIELDDDVRDGILHARAASRLGWDEETSANLLAALTKAAARLRPVTAESLRACRSGTHATMRNYWLVAIGLAIVIVPFSLASFVSTAISSAIRTDIAAANDLAVKLRTQLGPPRTNERGSPANPPIAVLGQDGGGPDVAVVTELQQFAAAIRAIDARARQLNWLVCRIEHDPYHSIRDNPTEIHNKFQLPRGLADYAGAADERIAVYQDVRYFAQSLLDDVSCFYGAIATCLLPVLYALLGTCAYLLRSLDQEVKARTFTPSVANSARFLIAGIGGAVVGLFNNFTITQGASIPPLAIAFLVGYAADVFFAFLEGLLQAFTKAKSSTSAPSATP